eukprot:5305072-Alexandrium_andersonii.AAC.1
MSASLVGSEMCIRDRGLRVSWQAFRRRYNQAADARATRAVAWAGRLPVSYTHLTLPTICSV